MDKQTRKANQRPKLLRHRRSLTSEIVNICDLVSVTPLMFFGLYANAMPVETSPTLCGHILPMLFSPGPVVGDVGSPCSLVGAVIWLAYNPNLDNMRTAYLYNSQNNALLLKIKLIEGNVEEKRRQIVVHMVNFLWSIFNVTQEEEEGSDA